MYVLYCCDLLWLPEGADFRLCRPPVRASADDINPVALIIQLLQMNQHHHSLPTTTFSELSLIDFSHLFVSLKVVGLASTIEGRFEHYQL